MEGCETGNEKKETHAHLLTLTRGRGFLAGGKITTHTRDPRESIVRVLTEPMGEGSRQVGGNSRDVHVFRRVDMCGCLRVCGRAGMCVHTIHEMPSM